MYQKKNRDQAHKINPLSEVVKNYEYDKASRSTSKITNQMNAQKETVSTEYTTLALDYVLDNNGSTMKTVPVYRGGMVVGFNAKFKLNEESEEFDLDFINEDDADEFLHEIGSLVELVATGADELEVKRILKSILEGH